MRPDAPPGPFVPASARAEARLSATVPLEAGTVELHGDWSESGALVALLQPYANGFCPSFVWSTSMPLSGARLSEQWVAPDRKVAVFLFRLDVPKFDTVPAETRWVVIAVGRSARLAAAEDGCRRAAPHLGGVASAPTARSSSSRPARRRRCGRCSCSGPRASSSGCAEPSSTVHSATPRAVRARDGRGSPRLPMRPKLTTLAAELACVAALGVACAAVLSGLAGSLDLALWDEASYLRAGQAIATRGLPPAEWGPLYALAYAALGKVTANPVEAFDLGYRALVVLPALAIYFAARRLRLSPALALLGSLGFLLSGAHEISPRPSLLALLCVLVGLTASTFARSRDGRLGVLAVSLLVASFARPELFVGFLAVGALALIVAVRVPREERGLSLRRAALLREQLAAPAHRARQPARRHHPPADVRVLPALRGRLRRADLDADRAVGRVRSRDRGGVRAGREERARGGAAQPAGVRSPTWRGTSPSSPGRRSACSPVTSSGRSASVRGSGRRSAPGCCSPGCSCSRPWCSPGGGRCAARSRSRAWRWPRSPRSPARAPPCSRRCSSTRASTTS